MVVIIFRRSNRVVLRPLTLADVPSILIYMNDPAVVVNLTIHRPMSEAAQVNFIEGVNKSDSSDIVLALEVAGEFIGTMGLHGINNRHGLATTGTVLAPKYQGQGYGYEAKMILLEYAFNTLNLRKICSNVHGFNEFSLKYAIKCGYKEEGRLRQHHYAMGAYHDRIQLAVFREDFMSLWVEFAKEHKDSLMTKT
jgi:RimJ/RimL family protein N-acetyltransferase